MRVQPKSPEEEDAPGVGVFERVARMKMKVGVSDGVTVGVRVTVGVGVGVRLGGMRAAVCVAAAPAVWATIVLRPPGTRVGAGGGAISVETSQLMITTAKTRSQCNGVRR